MLKFAPPSHRVAPSGELRPCLVCSVTAASDSVIQQYKWCSFVHRLLISLLAATKRDTPLHSRSRLRIEQWFGRPRIFRNQPRSGWPYETTRPARSRLCIAVGLLGGKTSDPPSACNDGASEAHRVMAQKCRAHYG